MGSKFINYYYSTYYKKVPFIALVSHYINYFSFFQFWNTV